MEYLGAILSYDNFEGRTIRHRSDKADTAFKQLGKVLRVNGVLTAGHRLRIYIAIVVSSLLYGLVFVGITAEVVRKLSSDIAQHLRKVLRIYEHGISNEEVLERAQIRPMQLLYQRISRLCRQITIDEGRSAALKHPEQVRAQAILEQVAALRCGAHGLTVLSGRKTAICSVDCPVCGLAFGTAEGLSQHLHRRHPDVRRGSKLRFCRAEQSLFGVPICRFCHFRAHDWSSLRKHLESGSCPWVQRQIIEGYTVEDLLTRIQDHEAQHPPQPPAAALVEDELAKARLLLQDGAFDPKSDGGAIRCLAQQCILCSQRIRYSARIKPHWQIQHPGAWEASHHSASSGSASLVALFRKPCVFCGSQAKNTRGHASQCPALFQALAAKALLQQGCTLQQAAAAGFTIGNRPRGLRQGSLMEHWAKQGSVSEKAPALPQRGCAPPTQAPVSITADNPINPPPLPVVLPQDWILRLVLRNPHNHCYANAGFLALLHALEGLSSFPRALRSLRTAAYQAAQRNAGLTLASQFPLRSLLRHWHFGPAQQDTLEFITPLIQAAGIDAGRWEARLLAEGRVSKQAEGVGPIMLPAVERNVTLQEALTQWHRQGFPHALCAASDLLLFGLHRYAGVNKSFSEVWFDEDVKVPVFGDRLQVRWHVYQVVAAVLHFGATPRAGHYRSLLRCSDAWHFTQDGTELAMYSAFRPQSAQSTAPTESGAQASDPKKQRTSDGGYGSGAGRRGWKPTGQKRQWQPSSAWEAWDAAAGDHTAAEAEIAKLKACMAQLQRMVLRHEDSINIAKIEVSYVAHFRIDAPNSLVRSIFLAADTWRKARENAPQTINKPLRATLLKCVFMELRTRIAEMSQEQSQRLESLGWFDPKTQVWSYLKWNAQEKSLERDSSKPGVTTEAVLSIMDDIDKAVPQPYAVTRFHPTRPLAAEMKGESLTFMVQFGQQNDHAEKLCTVVPVLCGLAVTQLIAMAIKPEYLQGFAWEFQDAGSGYTARDSGATPILGVCLNGIERPQNQTECLALALISHGQASWTQLQRLMQTMPKDASMRWPQQPAPDMAMPHRVTVGAWHRGPMTGLHVTMRRFPWCSRVFAGLLSTWDPRHAFTSATMSLNVLAAPHRDSHNMATSLNLCMPCSLFQGGELFIQDEEGLSQLQNGGPRGHVISLSTPVKFHPRRSVDERGGKRSFPRSDVLPLH
ncbi:unnamed protein product, partial [Symbiodinium sp. CCMP2456]